MIPGSERICVVHLVRKKNDDGALRSFIESYRRNAAGLRHELLLIFKGFPRDSLGSLAEVLDGIPHSRMFLDDRGFDIVPYLTAARTFDKDVFLFLNSFSRLLAPGWLELFYRHMRTKGVGLVGATASYQSVETDYRTYAREFRPGWPWYLRPFLPTARAVRYRLMIKGRFAPFPNEHVRTNAFMARKETLCSLGVPSLRSKWHAYHFESGLTGLSHRITSAGLGAIVAGADGRGYASFEWPESRTFWIGEQENLLVSDNQTRAYEMGTAGRRERLAYHAWHRYPDGRPRADPPPFAV